MNDPVRLIEVKENILDDNNEVANRLRAELTHKKTFLMNLMASPGAGKTTTLVSSLTALKNKFKIGVLEADIDSVIDAQTILKTGIEAIQLKTGGFCHLDATMVTEGLNALNYSTFDLVVLENVGNLVCPAEFDTGAHLNTMILSVPEGDDKPLKYPLMFSVCQVLIVNKIDYLSLSNFSMERLKERVRKLNPEITIFEISAKTGEGVDTWVEWLEKKIYEAIGKE